MEKSHGERTEERRKRIGAKTIHLPAAHVWLPGTPPICYRLRRGDDCMIKNSLIIVPVILLLSVPALAQQPDARRGSALAREHCAPCHAIDNTSESPRAAAPPFRELRLKYAISDLQRPLTQGPHTRFQFEPSQIESLMAYLKTLDR
jgi:cytochrome c